MRQIGTLSSEQQAGIFEDYLLTRGIKSTIDETGEGWVVWIYSEDQIEQAREELNTYLANADDPIYHEVAQTARVVRKETEKLNKQARKQVVNVRERWNRPAAARSPLTIAMIAVSVLVAYLTMLGEEHEPYRNLLSYASYEIHKKTISWYGTRDIQQGEVWRLVTPIFIHFGIMHILFNMLWLRDLGVSIELRLGSLKFLLMVLAIAISSNTAQYLYKGPSFGGMSGVVFGLFGYIWMKSKFDPESGFFLHPNTVFLMIGWFFICMTGAVGAIANTAHGVGLGVGMILGYAPRLWRIVQREM
ncbi:MAG: rhomboid family intramembrane serine protease [Planctomycetes bacterium]|nr:rhomboid family intramembrane serine protease [Planctomycetota bacterium]